MTTWSAADRGTGAMTVTMKWEHLLTSNGLPRPSDVQLGCFWQAADRASGVVHSLDESLSAPGSDGSRQVLRLGRRDETQGQVLFVDLSNMHLFRRFFVFAYGIHGTPEWEKLRPTLTVAAPSGRQLAMRFADGEPTAQLCVVASFHIWGDDLVIRREVDWVDGVQRDAAEVYGWTLDWNSDGRTLRPAP